MLNKQFLLTHAQIWYWALKIDLKVMKKFLPQPIIFPSSLAIHLAQKIILGTTFVTEAKFLPLQPTLIGYGGLSSIYHSTCIYLFRQNCF